MNMKIGPITTDFEKEDRNMAQKPKKIVKEQIKEQPKKKKKKYSKKN